MAVDEEQPLLEKKRPVVLYPNCRGCKSSYLQDPDAKLPWKVLATMSALTLMNALPISSLYPFLYFMVRDFNIAKSDKDIGYYAGCIGFAFMFGRFLTSIHWGMAADKYGRVPVMMIGVVSVIIFHTLFGLSTTFWMALLTRFLLGICNGMLGPVKAYASEICNEKHQARSVSLVATVWGVGLIIGPAMGGYFSQPAIKYPNLFPPGSLFDRYAYLLPSLLVTAFAIPTLCIAFYLPETVHNHDIVEVEKSEETKDEHAKTLPITHITSRSGSRLEDELEHSGRRRSQVFEYQADSENVEEEKKLVATSEREFHHDAKKKNSLFSNKALLGALALYCVWSLHDMAYTEVFSLWCVSPRSNGGLGLTTIDVGQILAISGFTMLFSQLFVFTPLVNLIGPVLISRIAAGNTVLLMVAYPLMAMLHGRTLWAVLCLLSVLKVLFRATIFTASFMLLNNSVTRDKRGAANGLGMSSVSLFKAVGPALGGSIFAFAQSRQSYILPGNQFVFFSMGLLAFFSFLCTLEPILPRSLDKPIREDIE